MGAICSKEEIHPTPDNGEENAVNEPEEIIGELPKLKTKDNEADSNRICLYAGPIDETLKNAKIDAAITKKQTDANPDCFVLSTTKACHLSLERLGQRIGVIGLNDCDNEDQWLVTAKQEASKLKKSDGLHMLIAMVGGDLDQAVKLAKICVDGVKVIFCHDEVKPSGEQIQYGTTIINLNPNDKKLASFATTFDQFNQPECKPARFAEL